MGTEPKISVKRIAITGPESTGKSWLAKELAEHFREPCVPEYARKYLNVNGNEYDFNDILTIAQGQFLNEEKLAKQAARFLFCDTDFLVTRIWCLFKYGKSHPWIDFMAENHLYQHYLLCNIDLPWEPDALREHPGQRQELFRMYENELTTRNLPFSIISGDGENRSEAALKAIESL